LFVAGNVVIHRPDNVVIFLLNVGLINVGVKHVVVLVHHIQLPVVPVVLDVIEGTTALLVYRVKYLGSRRPIVVILAYDFANVRPVVVIVKPVAIVYVLLE
jgi:hypothetical protein